MRIAHPIFGQSIESQSDLVTIVIENQKCFLEFLTDLKNQIFGGTGEIVISQNNKEVNYSRNIEILNDFLFFDMGKKSILNKINAEVEKIILSKENYEATMDISSQIETLIDGALLQLPGDLVCSQITASAIVKSAAIFIRDEYTSLPLKILDYIELVNEYEQNKIFVTVNLRDYITDREMELFFESAISHAYKIIMIESKDRKRIENEDRIIIDSDLCEIR